MEAQVGHVGELPLPSFHILFLASKWSVVSALFFDPSTTLQRTPKMDFRCRSQANLTWGGWNSRSRKTLTFETCSERGEAKSTNFGPQHQFCSTTDWINRAGQLDTLLVLLFYLS